MSDILIAPRPAGAEQMFGNSRRSAARVAADWLCLAATPTFALMALSTAMDSGQPDILCAATQHASPLGGRAPMYVLMSAFHAGPWLKHIFGDRSGARHA